MIRVYRSRRVSWSVQMIDDLLCCKREALLATNSESPPTRFGKKLTFGDYMHMLWVYMGYGRLGKSAENLKSVAYYAQKKRSKLMIVYSYFQTRTNIFLPPKFVPSAFSSDEVLG